MKRRETLRLIPVSFAGITTAVKNASAQKSQHPGPGPMPQPHEPLALRYTKQVRDMLAWIRETQSENLLEASHVLAETIMNKRTCWCEWDMGHNTNFDMFPERNGVPEIITMGYNADTSKKGDCFLASIWDGPHEDLVKKEIIVIGGPAPWGGDAKGQEFLRKDVRERKLRSLLTYLDRNQYHHSWRNNAYSGSGSALRPGIGYHRAGDFLDDTSRCLPYSRTKRQTGTGKG